jgi:hypothetical protein
VSIYFFCLPPQAGAKWPQCAKTESDEDLFLLGINPPLELSLSGWSYAGEETRPISLPRTIAEALRLSRLGDIRELFS